MFQRYSPFCRAKFKFDKVVESDVEALFLVCKFCWAVGERKEGRFLAKKSTVF